jgi:hypothetical protein
MTERQQRRIPEPPTVDDPAVGRWMRDVTDHLNMLPPLSAFSYDTPEGNVPAVPGTVAIWIKETGEGTEGWSSVATAQLETRVALIEAGGFAIPLIRVTTSYTVKNTDGTIIADATLNPLSVVMPLAPSPAGRTFHIKKIDSTVNAITVLGNGRTIDDVTSFTLKTQYECVTVQWDGTEWWIV